MVYKSVENVEPKKKSEGKGEVIMLRVFEAFSGIGTQRMALRNLGIEHEVVAIAEIDKWALLSYSAIHCDMTDEMINSYDKYPCREEIADWLSKMNIGYDFKNNKPYDWHKHITQNNNFLEKHYLANKLSKNLGDISKIAIEDIPDHDLFTYSFPCQDISVAGKGKGFEPGSGTRSSLLWECEKIIKAKKPKYLLMENVKALIFKKFKPGFEKWLRLLEELGYTNYWQVLNAKDYGVPQNRERVFCVSILGAHEPYVFPKPIPLNKRLKDVLEDEVDERFYINNEKADKLLQQLINKGQLKDGITTVDGTINEPRAKNVSNCIKARYDAGISNLRSDGTMVVEPVIKKVGNIYPSKSQNGEIHQVDGISPTLRTGNNDSPKIIEPKIVASRERNPDNPSDRTTGSPTEQGLEVNKQGISNTITSVQKDNLVLEPSNIKHTELPCIFDDRDKGFGVKTQDICPTQRAERNGIKCIGVDYRIRKLTPKECWRLMGISDEDFEKAQKMNSNTQLYKQAGNAIVVNVLEGIFRKLFLSKSKEKGNKLEEQLE